MKWHLLLLISSVLVYVRANDPVRLAVALNDSNNAEVYRSTLHRIALEAALQNNAGVYADATVNLSEPCKSHYNYYSSNIMNTWAMQMFDASTKIPEGILMGATKHLGNFDECLSLRDVAYTDGSIFHGQHCLATYRFSLPSSNNQKAASAPALMNTALTMAQCVPSSCSASDTAAIAKSAFASMLGNMGSIGALNLEIETQVNEQDCYVKDTEKFTSGDMVATAILSAFAGLVIFSTCYDISTKGNENRSKVAIAFSFYTNGKKLFSTSSGGEDTLHCLHGIRFITMAWIILCHRYQSGLQVPNINMQPYIQDFVYDWRRVAITSGSYSVDTFFFISGLLVAYVFFKTVPKTNSFNILMYYVHRYIRLTPAFAMIMLLQATLLTHAGSGPLWNSVASGQVETCSEYWWSNLLYVQIYVNPFDLCISHGWYLAVDMQLYWLSPLLLVPLWKWPRVGLGLIAILSIGGSIIRTVVYYLGEYPIDYFSMLKSPKIMEYTKYIYYPAYSRFIPYVMGIGLGYWLVKIKERRQRPRLSRVLALALWLLAGFLILYSLYIFLIFHHTDLNAEATAIIFSLFEKMAWSSGIGLVIFLCVNGYGGFPNTILSWKAFQPLSRLTYSAYLVHISVQMSQYGSARTAMYLDDITLFPLFVSDLVITLLIAIPMSLVFESPFIILEKEILGGKKKEKRNVNPLPTDLTNASNKELINGNHPLEKQSSNVQPIDGGLQDEKPSAEVV